jgi:predicted ribonuclease YlaK
VDPSEVLEWLDPTVMDDRILGATLRLQVEHPRSRVVLVTSDLNLQNKADAVGLPYAETPPTRSPRNPTTLIHRS